MTIFRRDFFDAEWVIQGAAYHPRAPLPNDGLPFSDNRHHYGKWFVIDAPGGVLWDGDTPRQKLYTSKEKPISGMDSLIMENFGNICTGCFLWNDNREPNVPFTLLNPIYVHLKFRIEEWLYPGSAAWQIGLTGVSGTHASWSPYQQAIGLIGGYYPPVLNNPNPRLFMKAIADVGLPGAAKTEPAPVGSEGILSYLIDLENILEIGKIYDLEILRYVDPVNGKIMVWLDGVPIPSLSFEDIPISFNLEGVRTVHIGSTNSIGIPIPNLAGAYSKVKVDDFMVSDEYLGVPQPSLKLFKLTVDCKYQVVFYLGNHGPFYTPQTFLVPAGTVPKIFAEPDYFEHFEINGSPMIDAGTGLYWKEIWNADPATHPPASDKHVIGMVNQAQVQGGHQPSPQVTPPIYADTLIMLFYTQAPSSQHLLEIAARNGIPLSAELIIDGVKDVTPYSRNRLEGNHIIKVEDIHTE